MPDHPLDLDAPNRWPAPSLAAAWWERLDRLGCPARQLRALREEIASHGLTPSEFYALLARRSAPAVLTFNAERETAGRAGGGPSSSPGEPRT